MPMVTRRALHRTGRRVIVKPFVVLAARCLGPGRLRLEMVKLAHDLNDSESVFVSLYGKRRPEPMPAAFELQPVRPSQRAA